MRLIDADAFHDFIHKHCGDPIEELWHELVRGQPTAYDVDKVVERLDDYLFEKYCVEGDNEIDKIVKSGGIE